MTDINKNTETTELNTNEPLFIDGVSGSFPSTKECHCGNVADKYYIRKYVNTNDNKVIRIFYRCRNCWSRILKDFKPEIDKLKTVDVMDLLKNYR